MTVQDAASSAAGPSSIKAIAPSTVHRITSNQVILDLQTAVKELLENSLDASASSVEVHFHDYGTARVDVIDNGTGIAQRDWAGVGLKYHTSKLSAWSDLTERGVSTFGFRGEALSSLCALCDAVTVTTCTQDAAPVGTVLRLRHDGALDVPPLSGKGADEPDLAKLQKTARQRGTTVSFQGLFAKLPVRRREFEKNAKREYTKAQTYLQAYALIIKGVRWSVSNTPKGGRKQMVLSLTPLPASTASKSEDPSRHLLHNVTALFGSKVAAAIVPLQLEVALEPVAPRRLPAAKEPPRKKQRVTEADIDAEYGERSADEGEDEGSDREQPSDAAAEGASGRSLRIAVSGLISKPSSSFSHSSSNRQFYYINGRPWDVPPRIAKAFNEVYRSFHTNDATSGNAAAGTFAAARRSASGSGDAPSTPAAARSDGSAGTGGLSVGGSSSASFPFVLADFALPPSAYDVNVSPDKRTMWLEREKDVAEALRDALERFYQPWRGRYALNSTAADAHASGGTAATALDAGRLAEDSKVAPPQRLAQTQLDFAAAGPRDARAKAAAADNTSDADDIDVDEEEAPSARNGRSRAEATVPRTHQEAVELDDEESAAEEESASLQDSSYETRRNAFTVLLKESRRAHAAVSSAHAQSALADQHGQSSPASPAPRHIPEQLSPAKRADQTLQAILLKASNATDAQRVSQRARAGALAQSDGEDDHESADESGDLSSQPLMAKVSVRQQPLATESSEERVRQQDGGEEEESPASTATASQEPLVMQGRQARPARPIVDDSQMPLMQQLSRTKASAVDESVDHAAAHDSDRESETSSIEVVEIQETERSRNQDELEEEDRARNLALLDQSSHVDSFDAAEVKRPLLALEQRSFAIDWAVAMQRAARMRPATSSAARAADTSSTVDSSSSDDGAKERGRNGRAAPVALQSKASILNQDVAAVEGELDRTIHKEDFLERMTVAGQFNHAFIIARRRAAAGAEDDLFIIDQHAADEKHNFEELQKDTRIRSQPLISPRTLELSAADELVAFEHMDTLKHNGFDITYDEESPPGTRVKLLSQPVSKGTVFGVKDLEELLHLLSDVSPSSSKARSVRCSKARAMFAMRACRKSVMVGKALSARQMTAILRHMGAMDSPWNCPHGRPTMRHLANLQALHIAAGGSTPAGLVHRNTEWALM